MLGNCGFCDFNRLGSIVQIDGEKEDVRSCDSYGTATVSNRQQSAHFGEKSTSLIYKIVANFGKVASMDPFLLIFGMVVAAFISGILVVIDDSVLLTKHL